MRIVISIVHTKGGVGKTTSAIYLAAAAARQGLRVVVLDADPQGSALLWAQAAAAAGEPMPFTVLAADMRMITAPPTADLVLIDTPPGYPQLIDAAIDAADFVLLPTGASPLDLMRAWPTLQVTAHRPTAVLLTQVMLNSKLAVEARAALEDEGVPVLSTPIVRREGSPAGFRLRPAGPRRLRRRTGRNLGSHHRGGSGLMAGDLRSKLAKTTAATPMARTADTFTGGGAAISGASRNNTRTTVYLAPDLRRRLKIAAAERDIPMNDIIVTAVERWLVEEATPPNAT